MNKCIRRHLELLNTVGATLLCTTGVGVVGQGNSAAAEGSFQEGVVVSAASGYSLALDAVRGAAGTSAAVGVTKPATAMRTPAAAAHTGKAPAAGGGYDFFNSDFILRMRGSAMQPEADIPRPLVIGVGVSEVWLEKEIGGEHSDCETYGAGYYAGEVAEQGILESSGPPDAGNKGGGIFNPTRSKDTKPNLSPGENLNAREPQIRDVRDGSAIYEIPAKGNGVRWEGVCDHDAAGHATGHNVDVAGAQAVGSTTIGVLDKKTGVYTGTSRAFVAGLETGSGTIDLISSIMQVKQLPGQAPTVSYRIGVNGGTLASGADVPYQDLTEQFNDAVNGNSKAAASLATCGLILMGPTASRSETGGGFARYVLNAPFFEAMVAPPSA